MLQPKDILAGIFGILVVYLQPQITQVGRGQGE